MPEGGKVTDLSSSSLLSRINQRARNTITGITNAWFGPLDPLVPIAQPNPIGRQWDYQVGYNINVPPRPYEPGMFQDLRNLAQNCDILRMVIETRKDQLEALPWIIAPKQEFAKNGVDYTDKIKEISNFLDYPDKEHDWSQWLRIIMEDIFVLDGAPIYRRPNKKGTLYALELIDASTIALKINADGRRPISPEPAYQQVLKGIPACDYTAEELLYLQRNPRSWTPYGYSPVEQVLITVNTQIRRMIEQLSYFTTGNIPLGFGNLPEKWTPEQITNFQKSFNAMREGNLEQRSQLVFMPSDFKYQPAKDAPLKSDFDEWLARKICFAFSISPEPFVAQVNRATAETSKVRASEEGLIPIQHFFKRFMDRIIKEDFQAPDLEFIWKDDKDQDPKEASDINTNYVKTGVKSIDEVRGELGLEQLGGAFAEPMLATGSGYIPVGYLPPDPYAFGTDTESDGQDAIIDPEVETKKMMLSHLAKRGKRKPIPFIVPQPKQGVRH